MHGGEAVPRQGRTLYEDGLGVNDGTWVECDISLKSGLANPVKRRYL